MPFIGSASLSGWRWGKCARCATCRSCSSPSRPAARSPLCPYSSLYPASRTWSSRLSHSTPHTHTQTHTPSFTPSPVQLHITMSLWTERRNWSSCADTKAAIATAPILALVSKKGFPDIRSDWLSTVFMFFLSRTMKKSWSRRGLLLGQDVVDNFSQPKHFSGDTS